MSYIKYYKQNLKNKNSNLKELNLEKLFNLSRIFYNLTLKKKNSENIEILLPLHLRTSIIKKVEIECYNVKRRNNSRKGILSLYKLKDDFFELAFFRNSFKINGDTLSIKLKEKQLTLKISKNFKNIENTYMIKLYKRGDEVGIVYCYKEETQKKKNNSTVAGIDIGMNILFGCFINETYSKPLLVSGKKLKRINYIYYKSNKNNKDKEKRNNRMNNEINYRIKRLFDYLNYYNVSKIFVGDFTHLKEGKTSFNFRHIPHDYLRKKMNRVSEINGIELIWVNESYSSKCSFIDFEDICYHNNYMGNREERGLFISKEGKRLHADLNGCGNILSKNYEVTQREHILKKPFFIS